MVKTHLSVGVVHLQNHLRQLVAVVVQVVMDQLEMRLTTVTLVVLVVAQVDQMIQVIWGERRNNNQVLDLPDTEMQVE
jgi:uncharacterized membrane protein YqjE